MNDFTHFDEAGAARQVDVTRKDATRREAEAEATVQMSAATLTELREERLAKGDALAVARVAGIQAAKETPRLIPLCHTINLGKVEITFDFPAEDRLLIKATAAATDVTGVEMEALTAVSVAALTIYDMIKSREKSAIIQQIRLLRKSGGKSGDYEA